MLTKREPEIVWKLVATSIIIRIAKCKEQRLFYDNFNIYHAQKLLKRGFVCFLNCAKASILYHSNDDRKQTTPIIRRKIILPRRHYVADTVPEKNDPGTHNYCAAAVNTVCIFIAHSLFQSYPSAFPRYLWGVTQKYKPKWHNHPVTNSFLKPTRFACRCWLTAYRTTVCTETRPCSQQQQQPIRPIIRAQAGNKYVRQVLMRDSWYGRALSVLCITPPRKANQLAESNVTLELGGTEADGTTHVPVRFDGTNHFYPTRVNSESTERWKQGSLT